MRICVIFNPTARGDKARRFRRILDSIGHQCALKATVAAGHARTLAAEAVHDGFDTIVAAGGDGTLNEVVNGLGDVPGGFDQARLGVLPLGTINVLARELGLPRRLMAAWNVIRAGVEIRVDLPQVEFLSNGRPEHRYFAQLGGAGLDSKAISLVNWEAKRKFGPLAYLAAGLRALRGPQSIVEVTNGTKTFRGELALLGNGRYYGGSYHFFRDAHLQDGKLHVCVFPKVNGGVLCRGILGMLTGRFHAACRAQEMAADSVAMSSSDKVLLELDGDNAGELPAKFTILPRTLRVIVAKP